MPKQNLDLVVVRTRDGSRRGPFRIWADPDDTPELLKHLEENARREFRRDASTRWLPQYEGVISFPSQRGRRPITVTGVDES